MHGLLLNSDSWYAQFRYFEHRYRNIALDLRGYGESSALPSNTKSVTELYVEDLHALFTSLNLKKPILVGFASGGHATLRFAAKYNNLISKLIVINSSPCFMRQDDWNFGFDPKALEDFIAKLNATDSLDEMFNIIFDPAIKENIGEQKADLKAWFKSMMAKAKKETILAFFNNIAIDDDRNLLKDITVPTLIINGKLSKEVPSEVGLYLRQHIVNSQFYELNNADQFAFATQSFLVNNLIAQFVSPSCSICIPNKEKEAHNVKL